jgi:outer membrane receptor protein involved in Fe transport
MKISRFNKHVSALALCTAFITMPVYAQDEAAADKETSALDEIVVTASGRDQTKIESSISVTSIDAQMIQDFQPSSEAEVFKLLPGIQVPGTSGPGGNSNIAVRGLPVATGGAPFVQLQEDGLPVVLFGDIQFGNNDYFTRFDPSVANIEAVRGGSATTFASQAPGAVINYISNYGAQEGGYIELKKGIDYSQTQLDFRYGGALTDSMNFHIGGYFKRGRGPLDAGYNLSDSIQVKANVTKEFGDGKGYFRLLFKYADTAEPNYTGAPALATISGGKVSGVKAFPGFDGRTDTNYSKYNQSFLIYNREGALERVKMDGITTKQKSIGAQFHYELSDNITVDDSARYSDISGGFASPFLGITNRVNTNAVPVGFTACNAPASAKFSANGVIGSCVNGSVVGAVRYASGPNAGKLFTGSYIDNNVNVKTNIRDLGSFVNDLTIAGKFDAGFANLTARVGYFYMDQTIAMDWHVNKSTRELSGNSPSQLDLYDAAGNKLTQEGIAGYNNNWGNCCARDYDLSYTNTAPYAQLVLDNDTFNLDGSVRFEKVKASGSTIGGGAEFNVNSSGVQIPTMTANGAREVLDYSRSYTSWTAGALWKATPDPTVAGSTATARRLAASLIPTAAYAPARRQLHSPVPMASRLQSISSNSMKSA